MYFLFGKQASIGFLIKVHKEPVNILISYLKKIFVCFAKTQKIIISQESANRIGPKIETVSFTQNMQS